MLPQNSHFQRKGAEGKGKGLVLKYWQDFFSQEFSFWCHIQNSTAFIKMVQESSFCKINGPLSNKIVHPFLEINLVMDLERD